MVQEKMRNKWENEKNGKMINEWKNEKEMGMKFKILIRFIA